MSEPEIRYLGDVQRLVLKPGDKVVVNVPGVCSADTCQRLREQLERIFEGHTVVVLTDGLKIGVMGDE